MPLDKNVYVTKSSSASIKRLENLGYVVLDPVCMAADFESRTGAPFTKSPTALRELFEEAYEEKWGVMIDEMSRINRENPFGSGV